MSREAFEESFRLTLDLEIRFNSNPGPRVKRKGEELPSPPRVENLEVLLKRKTGRQLESGQAELEEIDIYDQLSEEDKDRVHDAAVLFVESTESVTDPED